MADKPASTFVAARTAIVDENRMATWSFIKILLDWDIKLRNGLNSTGQLIGNIDPATRVLPRVEGLGQTLQNINSSGVMQPAGLFPASTLVQGAVIMPAGAADNRLGTAAIQPATAFDASGSAAGAQSAAQTYAAAQASTAQTNAENYTNSFASNAANLTTGTLPIARLSGLSVTITTAALTTGGTQGSMTFTNGLLTAQVQAT
jgi:hypothetical protein